MSDRQTPISPTFLMASALLALVCAHLFFYRLGEERVSRDAEARVILTASEMARKRTWVVPSVGGEGRWETPPLYVWAVKVAALFEDEVTPLAARLPGAVSMVLLVLLGAYWTYQHVERYPREDNPDLTPEGMAVLTGLILATSPEIFQHGREGTADSLYAFLCFAALYCFGESFEMRRSFYASRPWRDWVLAGYVLMGFAMMTKGPIVYLFVLLPYVLTCRAYKMNKPDWIHLPGALLSAAIGGWWYVVAMVIDPRSARVFFDELFLKRFGPAAVSHEHLVFYPWLLLQHFFPWVLLAGAMVYRTLRLRERTPTREIWVWSLVSSLVWLSLVGSKTRDYFLPAAPFVLLLAGDALTHWNFEGRAGVGFRVLIRIVRWGAIVLAIPASLLLSSDLGAGLFIALGAVCFLFLFHRQRASYAYAMWERTRQGAWFLAIAFFFAEAAYIQDVIQIKNLQDRDLAFIDHCKSIMPEGSDLYLYKGDQSALYSYHFGKQLLPITRNVADLIKIPESDTCLLGEEDLPMLASNPYVAVLAAKLGGTKMRPRAYFMKVLKDADPSTTASLARRYASAPPLRLAVLGSPAADKSAQREIARRLGKLDEARPFNEILALGNCLQGAATMDRLKFQHSFERIYKELLSGGAQFHAMLGPKDESIAWAIERYPTLQMGGARYYSRDFEGGLARYFALDADGLRRGDAQSAAQWAWLASELRSCPAPWKIVALSAPILSLAKDAKNDEAIAKRLLPMLDEAKAQICLWSDEPWFQCVEDPAHAPVFFGVGFSGEAKAKAPSGDPRLKLSYGEKAGFVVFQITPEEAGFEVQNRDGVSVAAGSVLQTGGLRK